MRPETKPCDCIFSNGTQFEIFMETQCLNGCVHYRNDHCKILNRIYLAMFLPEKFPYDDLLDAVKYGNKYCKRYSTEKPPRRRRIMGKSIGQITIDEVLKGADDEVR